MCVFVHKQNVRPTAGRSRHPNNAPDQLALYNTAAAAADSAAQKTRAKSDWRPGGHRQGTGGEVFRVQFSRKEKEKEEKYFNGTSSTISGAAVVAVSNEVNSTAAVG